MNYRLKLSVLVVIALSFGLWKWSAAQFETAKVFNVTNYYEAAPAPVSVEAPALGALSTDPASSDHLNVNGFDQYVLVGLLGNGYLRATTTVAFTDPFKTVTTTAGDVVIDQVTAAFGYTGATSTVTSVEITGIATTTALEFDCTGAATPYATSTPALLNTETAFGASSQIYVRSGMTSTTNAGGGSYVVLSTSPFLLTTQILLTPAKPYLVCKAWHATGGSLSAFTDSAGTAAVKVTAFISRQR